MDHYYDELLGWLLGWNSGCRKIRNTISPMFSHQTYFNKINIDVPIITAMWNQFSDFFLWNATVVLQTRNRIFHCYIWLKVYFIFIILFYQLQTSKISKVY